MSSSFVCLLLLVTLEKCFRIALIVKSGNIAVENCDEGSVGSAFREFHQHSCLRNELEFGFFFTRFASNVSVFKRRTLEWGELLNLRIIINGETEKNHLFQVFSEKIFTDRKVLALRVEAFLLTSPVCCVFLRLYCVSQF